MPRFALHFDPSFKQQEQKKNDMYHVGFRSVEISYFSLVPQIYNNSIPSDFESFLLFQLGSTSHEVQMV